MGILNKNLVRNDLKSASANKNNFTNNHVFGKNK